MSLEEYTWPEWLSEEWQQWQEKVSEISEKFKEQVRRSSAWIQRTKKDEKKAKKWDFALAGFLVKLIVDKKYDFILEKLFNLMDKGFASNFLLGILSLVYIDISNYIRKNYKKDLIKFNYQKQEEIKVFDASNIDIEIQNRINAWVEDIIFMTTNDYSSLLTQRLRKLIKQNKNDLIWFIKSIFSFFLKENNIQIIDSEAINISAFILSEIEKAIKNLNLEQI